MRNAEHTVVGRIITWSVRNRFLVLSSAVIAIVAGVWAIRSIALDAIPDLSDPQVIVFTEWPGRDPQTIEDQVTYPLTSALLAVPNVRAVRGFSYFGTSFVYVIFDDGVDLYWARSRVLEYLNQSRSGLPSDAVTTLGPDATGVGWVFQYTLEDRSRRHDLGELRALQDWYVRYQLMSVPGVSEVASVGGFKRQYQVTVSPHLMQAYDLKLNDVIHAIQNSNRDVGGRLLEMAETEYMIRGRGYLQSVEDIENAVVKVGANNTPVLVRDIANVQMGPDIRRGIAEKNGEGEVVGGIVVMRHGENALRVIDDVKKKIRDISAGLPEGVAIHTAYDRSELIDKAIGTLKTELLQQIIIVALVCALFLWHVRSALVAAIALPLGVLISFIVMRFLGVSANIMSLGGIAIAIGAMVDATVVMIENTHKRLEESPEATGAARWKVVTDAALEVGPSLFFSLLIITVSFLPVFALQGQAGRLFAPLAYTKTFAMAASALIAVTVTPILIGIFVRGKIHSEKRLPISRLLIGLYRPFIIWTLAHRRIVIGLAIVTLALSFFPLQKLGSEFMPPLNEEAIMYMPTSMPGISETEAKRVLQTQDKLFKTFPEIDVVFGKIGRAETATDPAPLTMVETTVSLKPAKSWPKRWIEYGFIRDKTERVLDRLEKEGVFVASHDADFTVIAGEIEAMVRRSVHRRLRNWTLGGASDEVIQDAARNGIREGITDQLFTYLVDNGLLKTEREVEALQFIEDALDREARVGRVPLRRLTMEELMHRDLDTAFQFAGLTNAWLMPIKTRIEMLSTGIKTPIGIKVYGEDLEQLQRIGVEIETVVKGVPGTLSAISERVMGGNYLDFEIDRLAIARHGLTINDVQDVIETAIGGKNVTQTVEGRYRFPVNVRYPRELRDDPSQLGRVLVDTPGGAQIPIDQLATIEIKKGPPAIKSENALLQTIVYIDLQTGQDIGGYVRRAQAAVAEKVELPSGYYVSWSGQYEAMQEVNRRLRVLVPISLLVILLLLYINFGRIRETLIVMLSLPFAAVGGIWFMYFLDYNLSVASGLGFIALAGLAAETGVVMLLFLNIAYDAAKEKYGVMDRHRVHDAIIEGAVMRVRPKMMTVATTIVGLMPIMWMTGVGAQPMKRMAAPMIGGLLSSTVLTLLVIPVIYAIIRLRESRTKDTELTV